MGRKRVNQDNKVIWILLGIICVCFLVIGFGFYKYFYGGASSSKYGERLEGIENHQLSKTLEQDISGLYSSEASINSVKLDVKGRIIYVLIDFKKSIKVSDAQTLAIKALTKISENDQAYYDVQFILTYSGNEENVNFPIFGAKSSSSLKVVW